MKVSIRIYLKDYHIEWHAYQVNYDATNILEPITTSSLAIIKKYWHEKGENKD